MRLSAANAMRFVDDVFDETMQAIKDAGQWENTIVLFTSDNGGAIFPQSINNNFPLRGGKRSIFDGGYRVVQFLAGGWFNQDQAEQGRKSDTFVFINDLAPTFLDMVGGSAAVDKLYKKELDSNGKWKVAALAMCSMHSIVPLSHERLFSFSLLFICPPNRQS